MFRDPRVALRVVGNRPKKAAHGPDVVSLGRLVRDGVPAGGRLGHAEAVRLDLRLLQLGIAQRPSRVLERLVVLGEIRPGSHLARSLLPAVPPREPYQRHVVVARPVLARLGYQPFKFLLRAEALERLPGGLASLRAPEQPRSQRVRSEEENVVRSENSF